MVHCAPSRRGSNRRSVSLRLTLEQLESRLPPGDMIGLAGIAWRGLSLAESGPGLRIAPPANPESPFIRQAANPATSGLAPPSTRIVISLISTPPTPAHEPARSLPAAATGQASADQELFRAGLTGPFDGSPQTPAKTPSLSQAGAAHANDADLLRGPTAAGGGERSHLASSADPIAQPLNSTNAGGLPPVSAPGASQSSSKGATMAAANTAGKVVSSAPVIASPGNGITLGSGGDTRMPESDTPPPTPP